MRLAIGVAIRRNTLFVTSLDNLIGNCVTLGNVWEISIRVVEDLFVPIAGFALLSRGFVTSHRAVYAVCARAKLIYAH